MKNSDKEMLEKYLPQGLISSEYSQELIPRIAKDNRILSDIENSLHKIPTIHNLYCADSRSFDLMKPESVHLIITSPPYWTLKRYNETDGQVGHIYDYERFLIELEKIWNICFEALTPGGRLVCVVGDVCLSRRNNNGEHTVVPLHASIQEQCRKIGFNNLAPIIWHKIANATYEVKGNTRFLGKPYEPNGIIKNDIEFLLMERKPGGYRKPTLASRILSVISDVNHKHWFNQIWHDIPGASTKDHPAPYPLELAERLVRMFSFVGDTVLDPFMGTATTNLAAAKWGRNSVGIEVDPEYFTMAIKRMENHGRTIFSNITIHQNSKLYEIPKTAIRCSKAFLDYS
ncbi:MAG: site-specific DNA-methyltransferase [Spirochaetes bacterium]|nr:site-specific DNA-methyltransferase [Spirochaetota bacterium]